MAGSDATTGSERTASAHRPLRKSSLRSQSERCTSGHGGLESELLKDIDLRLAPQQNWVRPSAQLLEGIRSGTVDLFCVTVQEYRQVAQYVDTGRVITSDYGGDELLVVVREGSGIAGLAGLRGRSLILQDAPNTSIAEPWLAVSLWREGLESPDQLLGRITKNAKLAQVVLPVFFGQADACVVTRRGLAMMFELNPQLARKLKILLVSPAMVSAFFACRRDYPAHLKKPIFDRLLALKSSPTSKQVLTLFQSPDFTALDAECLHSANSVLEIYERRRHAAESRRR